MLNSLLELAQRLVATWKCWVMIPPWDVGIRVRFGRRGVSLQPGLHLRIPFVDEVTLVNTRTRTTTAPPITIGNVSSQARVIRVLVAFRIVDPLAATMRYAEPHIIVQALAQSAAARGADEVACRQDMQRELDGSGIEISFVSYTDNIVVPAIRVMQNMWDAVSDPHYGPSSDPIGRY